MRPTLALFQRACVICAASFRRWFVNLHHSVCICTAWSSHGRLDKHAKLEGRWKACSCLVSLSVCWVYVLVLDWQGLSNNMAGTRYGCLVAFYPLKWYSIIFDGLFCPKLHLLMIHGLSAIQSEMLGCLKPHQNNCFDMSWFLSWQWH